VRPRGRRHWTETVDVNTVTRVTSGPDTGAETETPLHVGVKASVQPVSDAEAIRHGLDTSTPTYWVRFAESPPRVGDHVIWRGETHVVAMVSEGQDVDTQLLVRRRTGVTS
jgi:hypothetical protein